MKILLLEDDIPLNKSINDALTYSGYEVDTLNYLISIIAYIDPDIPFLETGHNFSDNTEQMVKAFQKKYKDIKIRFISRFPYGIHYTYNDNKIIVIAVFHTSRSPKNWSKRLGL